MGVLEVVRKLSGENLHYGTGLLRWRLLQLACPFVEI